METGEDQAVTSPAEIAAGPAGLSQKLRVLCFCSDQPEFQPLAVALEAQGCLESRFLWVTAGLDGLTALRDETFDAVLIAVRKPSELPAAFEFLAALRAGGHDDAVVFLTRELSGDGWADACRLQAETLVTRDFWHSPALAPMLERALRHAAIRRENHRLSLTHQRRLVRERHEAEHLLRQQQQLIREIAGFDTAAGSDAGASLPIVLEPCRHTEFHACRDCRDGRRLPAEFDSDYQELLRTCVIMGSGSLGSEIQRLAECMAKGGISPRESLELHLEQVQALIRGRGSRSARHVMARADLLALELMIHLGEWYREATLESERPSRELPNDRLDAA